MEINLSTKQRFQSVRKSNVRSPLVSVIMPVLNGGKYLPISLQGIEQQNYPNIEIIAVDDGSTDNSFLLLENFCQKSARTVSILRHPDGRQSGIAASYRLALKEARGKYIVFLDQDDYWPIDKISTQLDILKSNPDVGLIFSDVFTFNNSGKTAEKPFQGIVNRPPANKPFDGFKRLLWGNYILTFSNIMVRRELIRESDFILEPEGYQDWMFLLLLSTRCQFYYCTNTHIYWRQHEKSFHGEFKQQSNYRRESRQLRKAVLFNTMEKILNDPNARFYKSPIHHYLTKMYWQGVITTLNFVNHASDKITRLRK